ncbi:MAG: hypothetical protein ACLU38_08995 [Dysosmobacter sp.]
MKKRIVIARSVRQPVWHLCAAVWPRESTSRGKHPHCPRQPL